MANPNKGDLEFDAGGKTYTLRFDIDAICELEAKAMMGLPAIASLLSDPSSVTITMLRAALWAGLRTHHPKITLREAGDVIVPAGGVVVLAQKIGEAFALAFPETQSAENKNPPEPSQTATETAGSDT